MRSPVNDKKTKQMASARTTPAIHISHTAKVSREFILINVSRLLLWFRSVALAELHKSPQYVEWKRISTANDSAEIERARVSAYQLQIFSFFFGSLRCVLIRLLKLKLFFRCAQSDRIFF